MTFEIDRHHLLYPKSEYHTPTEKHFRQLGGFVIRMDRHYHNTLHASLEPPIKPSKGLMDTMIDLVPERVTEPYIQLYENIEILANFANERYKFSLEAYQLYSHLVKQARFIEQGRVYGEE